MQQAKETYEQLCQEHGTETMNQATGGHQYLAIYDYMKDGTLQGFILSLYEPAPAYID